MFVYAILFIYISFISSLKIASRQKVLLIVIAIYIVMAFKSVTVGVDTKNYLYQYLNAYSPENRTGFEPAFHYILYFCRTIVEMPPRIFWMLSYALIIFPLVWLTRLFVSNAFLTFIMYITIGAFAFNMSGLRQSICVAFVEIATILYLFSNMKKKYSIVLMVAILFLCINIHNTSKVCFILLLLPLLREMNKKIFILSLFIPIACLLVSSSIPTLLEPMFEEMKYASYESFYTNYSSNIFFVFGVPYAVFAYTSYLYYRGIKLGRVDAKNTRVMYLYILSCISVCMSCLGLDFLIISRLIYYFSFYNYLLIPLLLYKYHVFRRETVYLQTIFIVLLCMAYFFIVTPGDVLKIDNYSFSIDL